MNLNEALARIAPSLDTSLSALITYADEDTIGGFHPDPAQRQWDLGSMWSVECQFIYAVIRALRPERVLEIGVGNGCTTTHILTALARNGTGTLTSVDPHPYNTDNIPLALRDRWTHIPADGVEWLDNNIEHFDVAIEDAMHSYEMTYALLDNLRDVRTVISHDAMHATVGATVRRAWSDTFGAYMTALIEPADCGLAWRVLPAPPPRVVVRDDGEYILYLPIIEPGAFHGTAFMNKRGLYDALSERADVHQIDYLAIPQEHIEMAISSAIDTFRPTMLLTQLHGADRITPDMLAKFHERVPLVVNWSGDSWNHSLISPDMLALCKHVDLQLVAAPGVLPIYTENGIKAAFWQIAYECPFDGTPLMPTYDVVFLGSVISDKRRALLEFLRTLDGISVGIYGDWDKSDGYNTYDFGAGEALYRNAKIAIADCAYPDQQNYVSNRPIQILMAGGAALLHQHVPLMAELLGIEAGVHYAEWTDFADLERLIRMYLKKGNEPRRRKLVKAGYDYAAAHHTYTNRVNQLFNDLLPEVKR
jgi:predicted O-methyltransferase YrrM